MTMDGPWPLDMDAGPIFLQIAQNVRHALARRDLAPGEKLPSARELAHRLGVNPNTVVHAYTQLERQGVIETKRGLGTFVREDAPVATLQEELLHAAAAHYAGEVRRLGVSKQDAIAVVKEVLDAGNAR